MRQRIEDLGLWSCMLLALSSGFIIALGAPPDGLLLANWLGFVPIVLVATRERTTPRHAAWFGFAGGLGIGLGGFPWIAGMLVNFAGVPAVAGAVGLFFFSAWMAIPYAIWALGLRLGPRDGVAGLGFGVALFVALQFTWPVLFPYSPILGFAEVPELMQFAEFVGVHGIEALVVAASICLARALVAVSAGRRGAYAGAWVVVPLVMFFMGSQRMQSLDAEAVDARELRIAVVQPNVGIHRISSREKMERLTQPSRLAEEQGAQLVVWPEAGVYPYSIERPLLGDSSDPRRRVLSRHHTPTVFGAGSYERGGRYGYNSAFYISGDGEVLGSYDKVNLVPLGESIPLINPNWVTDRIPSIAHHYSGTAPARFELAGANSGERNLAIAPLICYEDIIPTYVHRAANQEGGVDLFVNLTIDAWYGDTAEPWEHLALAQFRSVEHRVPLVRSVSTGVSAIVDYNGRLVAHIPLRPVTERNLDEYPAEFLIETLKLPRNTALSPTVYAQVGWLLPHLCQLVVVAWAASIWWERRRANAA